MFIVITLALFLILAFALGVTVFRQTRAIWTMESQNAVTINNTLNTFTCFEPLLLIVAVVIIALTICTVKKAF